MLLVFFASLTGRMDSWLGPDGKGLMDAFNPADLHIAAQTMGKASNEDIEDADKQPQVMEALDAACGGDVYLHENSWPGLYGILSAMELFMYFMYGIVVILISVITALTGSKLLVMEQKDMGVYRSFGFTAMQLRISFALRFGMVSLLGALIGVVCSAFLTDPLVAALLRMFGISNFSSHPGIGDVLLPALVVITAFTVFAWIVAGKIRTGKLIALINEA